MIMIKKDVGIFQFEIKHNISLLRLENVKLQKSNT